MFGLISKKRVAMEIAKIYNQRELDYRNGDNFKEVCSAQSALNFLCSKLGIKPMHLNKLGGGTGEMLCGDSIKLCTNNISDETYEIIKIEGVLHE